MNAYNLPLNWTLSAHEDESQSWLVLTGPSGKCAFSVERGSVRAQVLQDFIAASVIRKVYKPTEQLVCRKCGSSEVMPWPTK
jgi:hypothetical protein